MNKIFKLLDEEYVIKFFRKKVLPHYPFFTNIKKVKILPIKNNIWRTTYHVVLEFKTYFITQQKEIKKISLFCSAHSDEPRKNSFLALKFLWRHGFKHGDLTLPHPLFFSSYFNAFFYRGIKGKNLYYFIKEKNYKEIENIIPKAAIWLAKLHKLPVEKARNFNKENSRIKTALPGSKIILDRIKNNFSNYYPAYKKVYSVLVEKENSFLSKTKKKWLIHGDAHPENVIKVSQKKIAMIDFTDICLSDFARDLGSFMQQLEFMSQRKIGKINYINDLKKIFLNSYLKAVGLTLDDALKERINYYYNWTALRTATLFLLKDKPEPERAHGLLLEICRSLKVDIKD